MFFYIHYILMTSGLSGTGVLLAVFFKNYTDASQGEIGVLLMSFPFVLMVIKPVFCSMADRKQAHKLYFVLSLTVELIGYSAFAVIPFFPQFYQNHPRLSWYILVAACHVGNAGLGVGWSLGDCLAVNMSQKNGTPFGRMRLMGTVSWGVYGFIIGQINEVYFLPKYVPAFFILLASIIAEIIVILCWNDEDFEMVDPLSKVESQRADETSDQESPGDLMKRIGNFVDSAPSSLGGTLRLNAISASFIHEVLASEDLQSKLKSVEASGDCEADRRSKHKSAISSTLEKGTALPALGGGAKEAGKRNPQFILLKMILLEDGRVIKYVLVFTAFGLLHAPMNFVFLSVEGVCHERGYNFSQLAGCMMISLAAIETIAFFTAPWFLPKISRSVAISFGFLIMAIRFAFYAGWYYTGEISPYWAVVGEQGLGLCYAVFCTIQADVSLMFANQSRLFIPELRRLGYLSDERTASREKIEAEERSVKMALRATMQALFDGFMSGLGFGFGALLCGIFIEIYSYVSLWKVFCTMALISISLHQLIELTRSRWSDTFRPKKGTKAYEIMQLNESLKQSSKTNIDTPAH